MAASTYTKKANLAQRGKLVSLCPTTAYTSKSTNATVLGSSTGAMSAEGYMGIPGAIKSTIVGDVFRIPINKDDSNMSLFIVADTMASSSSYLQLAIRKPQHQSTIQDYSPAWGIAGSVGTSTQNSGWDMVRSTALMLELSGGGAGFAESFMAGPFESAKYAMNFGPTSTSGIDKNQNYFECMVGLSTVGSTNTWTEFAASAFLGGGVIYVVPIETP
jgi:hypothetical protein